MTGFGPLCGDRSRGGRVLRGGSWNNNQRNARVSVRNNNRPDNANNNIGFRVSAHDLAWGTPHRQCLVSSGDGRYGPRWLRTA